MKINRKKSMTARSSKSSSDSKDENQKDRIKVKSKSKRLWHPKSIGKVVAFRQFELSGTGKRKKTAHLEIGLPVQVKNPTKRDPWACPFLIKGLGSHEFHYVFGIDSVQAICGAFDLSSSLLRTFAQWEGYNVQFLHPEMNLIFDWLTEKDSKKAKKKYLREMNRPFPD